MAEPIARDKTGSTNESDAVGTTMGLLECDKRQYVNLISFRGIQPSLLSLYRFNVPFYKIYKWPMTKYSIAPHHTHTPKEQTMAISTNVLSKSSCISYTTN